MRVIIVGAVVAACLIGSALAQVAAPARPVVQFDAMPDGYAFANNYPQPAIFQNVEGLASLCCAVQPDRTLSCAVAYEWPSGQGFGTASMAVARDFRVSEESYRSLAATGDMSLKRTIRWVLPDYATPDGGRALEEAAAHARTLTCAARAAPAIGR